MQPWMYMVFVAVLVAFTTAVVTYHATVVRMTHVAHGARFDARQALHRFLASHDLELSMDLPPIYAGL